MGRNMLCFFYGRLLDRPLNMVYNERAFDEHMFTIFIF